MDTVTYPDESVAEFINKSVVPLQITTDKPLATDFNVQWTPSLLILDQEGKEHHRTVGFMAPEELIPSLLLGIGNAHFNKNEFAEAISCYEKVLAEYSACDAAPEAIFQKGVSLYKSTGNPKPLREAYEILLEKYPDSQWTKRAYPYRLIQ
jgi:tetratricopeptide (TPR) repeat protein